MALPILIDLEQEITRLMIAGSPHAKGDPRLKKFIPALEKLAEKAPVMATLAQRLTALVEGDEKTGPEALLSVGTVITSIMYTQGSSETDADIMAFDYEDKPLALTRIHYSRLHEVIEVLESGGQKHSGLLTRLLERGDHKDPRLYPSYVKAVTDVKSPISSFVCEKILPDIGADIAPFLLAEFDAKGSKRHARILRVLRMIMGKDAAPLAEKALAEGAPPVMTEALLTLGQDPAYEETLIAYTSDRKGEIRGAALAGLAIMGSDQGAMLLLEGLDKSSISHLEEALVLTKDPAVLDKMLVQARMFESAYKMKDKKKTPTAAEEDPFPKSLAKWRILLSVIAARTEWECLTVLEAMLMDKTYGDVWNDLALRQIMENLCEDSDLEKRKMIVRVCNDASRAYYKLKACISLYSVEEVYDRCHRDVNKDQAGLIHRVYNIDREERAPDNQKTWDRRWAQQFAGTNPYDACVLVYNDDLSTWKKILEAAAALVKSMASTSYLQASYRRVLVEAFRSQYPEARKYYEKFVKNGADRAKLIEEISRAVPDAQENWFK
ncbi:MAG: hypothetical protein LBB49_04470 [Gracilibacteraceae bacterium]|jgi:hypothetical protein|nr:hypothetical protein [Gracilibacteraceae bacterium]